MEYLSVSESARRLSEETGQPVSPRAISDLFYKRELRDDIAPMIAGRRAIPETYLPTILMVLKRRGHVQPKVVSGD